MPYRLASYAVQRGVDIRFMVDSVGSIDSSHSGLKALETCAVDAGFIRNANGELTTRKARVQVVVFNAISKVFVKFNRRAHDKLLVIDGSFPEGGFVITGDALFEGGIGRTDLPGGNYDPLIQSIRTRLLVLPPETIVYPGHGPSSTIGKEIGENPFLFMAE